MGTGFTVSVVLKMLAGGKSLAEVLHAYPELEAEDVQQAMQYAAWVVSDQIQMAQVRQALSKGSAVTVDDTTVRIRQLPIQ
jgi:hypothetical protein